MVITSGSVLARVMITGARFKRDPSIAMRVCALC
jgi:hypothetical protein